MVHYTVTPRAPPIEHDCELVIRKLVTKLIIHPNYARRIHFEQLVALATYTIRFRVRARLVATTYEAHTGRCVLEGLT